MLVQEVAVLWRQSLPFSTAVKHHLSPVPFPWASSMPCPSADHYGLLIYTVPMARTVNAILALPSPWSTMRSTADASLFHPDLTTHVLPRGGDCLTLGYYQNDVDGELSSHCMTAVL